MRDYEAKIQVMPIGKVKPSKKNVRTHTKGQIDFLCELISSFGFDQPIVVDKDGIIIKGHGRLLAAKQLKMKKVPVLIRDDMSDDYVDLSRIVDNDTVEQDWDSDTLTLEAASLDKLQDDFGDEVNSRVSDLLLQKEPDLTLEPKTDIDFVPQFKHTCPHCSYRWG